MNFDIKDVKSWANRHDVKIGDEGYFFYDIDKLRNFENEYIKPVKSKLSAIRDNCATCFQIDNGCDGYNVFPFFLPLDTVKKDKSEKKYRPFKDAYEFYNFIGVILTITRKEFRNHMLLGLPITYRERKSPQYTTIKLITRVVLNETDKACKIFINKRDFEDWFDNYEIMNVKGEWQPFGVEDCTGE